MPNWCDCELNVRGKTEDVHRLREAVKSDDEVLSANRIIPYPEKFRRLDEVANQHEAEHPDDWQNRPKDGFNSGGYDWCIQNWGTKWGFCHSETISEEECQGETTLEYRFASAWDPPIPLIKKLGEMFPMLEIELRYFECGAAFNGLYSVKDGQVDINETGAYFGHRGG